MNAATTSAPRYSVVHETRYDYDSPVSLSQQFLHLTPRDFAFQRRDAHRIVAEPCEDGAKTGSDYFGNGTTHLTIVDAHHSLLVRAESAVTLAPRPSQAQAEATQPWQTVAAAVKRQVSTALLDACRYLYASPHVPASAAVEAYARASFAPGRTIGAAMLDLNRRIHADFEFDPEATEVSTPLETVLAGRRGVCQDFAHLMIAGLRSVGLAARYVSGYILTHPAPGMPRLVGADASHAWVSAYCPELGWVDVDPTNCCLVQGEHITLGWGRDYSDVAPIRGVVLGGGAQELSVSVTVTPLSV